MDEQNRQSGLLTRRPRLLQIAMLGHPVLRAPCLPVETIDAPDIQELIDDMIATCADANGVGLAAPQVYRSLRIIIVAPRRTPAYPDAPGMMPTAMINPVFEALGADMIEDWEGCLSIPGLRGIVARHASLDARYLDRTGTEKTSRLDGFVARIFQHELDHINGVMFTDRVDPRSLMMDREYQRKLDAAGASGMAATDPVDTGTR